MYWDSVLFVAWRDCMLLLGAGVGHGSGRHDVRRLLAHPGVVPRSVGGGAGVPADADGHELGAVLVAASRLGVLAGVVVVRA